MNLSFWENRYINNSDICIVGGGLVGMISALELRKKYPEAKIVIVERGFLGMGASTKNAGFACFGSVGEIHEDIEQRSEQESQSLIAKRWNGLQRLRSHFKDDAEIGLEFNGSYELFLNEEGAQEAKLTHQIEKFNGLVEQSIGEQNVFEIRKNSFGFNVQDRTIFNRLEGQLDVSKLISSLKKLCAVHDVNIVQGFELVSFIEESSIKLVFKNDVELTTEKLVFATNAFTKQFFSDLDIVPYRNQLVITAPIPNLAWNSTFHFKGGLGYFRNVGNRILLGGRRDIDMENENTKEFAITDNIQDHLVRFLRETLNVDKHIDIDQRWSGILALADIV